MSTLSYLSRDCRIVELIWNLVGIRFDASNEEWIRLEEQKNLEDILENLQNIVCEIFGKKWLQLNFSKFHNKVNKLKES